MPTTGVLCRWHEQVCACSGSGVAGKSCLGECSTTTFRNAAAQRTKHTCQVATTLPQMTSSPGCSRLMCCCKVEQGVHCLGQAACGRAACTTTLAARKAAGWQARERHGQQRVHARAPSAACKLASENAQQPSTFHSRTQLSGCPHLHHLHLEGGVALAAV